MTSEIRSMRADDMPQVEALYRRVFGDEPWFFFQQRFHWQFEANPSTSCCASRIWVGELNGEVKGFLASFPMRLKVAEREFTVLCPCDLMAAPEARSERFGQRLIRMYIKECGGLANALAYSPPAARLYDRLEYRSVPAEPVYLRPIRAASLVQGLAEKRFGGDTRFDRLGRLACRVGTPLAEGATAIVNVLRGPRPVSGVRVEHGATIGDEFDDLWRRGSRDIPLVGVRDAAFLRWRFEADPITSHTIFAARDRSGRLLGYAVTCLSTRRGLKVGKLMDVFCAPIDAKRVVGALAGAVLHAFRTANVDLVTTKGMHPAIREPLRRFLYLSLPAPEMPARFLWTGDPTLSPLVYDAANWHLTHADGDEDFVP